MSCLLCASLCVFFYAFVLCSYELEYPRSEDRAKFFSQLLETAMDISEQKYSLKNKAVALPVLPKAPKLERERTEAELQAQAEEEEHSLRQMRMCLRDICNRLNHICDQFEL